MKRIYLFLTFLIAMFAGNSAMAIEQPSGIMYLGDAVTTVETGKWYVLVNTNTKKFVKENNKKLEQTTTTPNEKGVDGNEGYLITLEDAGNGKYYIRTANGNYYLNPSSSARGTSAEKTADDAFTITPIDGASGHFGLQGTSNYYLSAPSGGGGELKGVKTAPSSGSTRDWQFYSINFSSVDELTGQDLYNYQMKKKGLIRLYNKRKSTSYLTSNEAGSVVGASKAATGLTQVWILEETSSKVYTLRSAQTSEYLQDSYNTTASSSKSLYIQFSPNNTGTQSFVNISSAQDFSGQTCMNLKDNGTSLTKWSYANDAGSDWAIELVTDITEDEVREHLNAVNGYVGELKDGAYYRIISTNYNLYATELDGNDVKSIAKNDDNFAQYWKLIKSGEEWKFQNVLTQNYIQRQTTTSVIFRTNKQETTLYPKRTDDKWIYNWTIATSKGNTQGMHTADSQGYNIVLWSTNAAASIWAFEEVSLTDEQIEAAHAAHQEYDDLVANLATIKEHLANLFADDACTTLKEDIQALSDDALAANDDFAALNDVLKAMVLKIKNDTWQQFTNTTTGYSAGYEKFFRISDYKIYSNYEEMCNASNFTMSNTFGRLSGPTGIYANAGDIVYVFVDKDAEDECQLQLEMISTDGVAGNHPTGTQFTLHKGLNIFCPSQQMLLYVFHQLNNTQKYLANYPDIKVHIEGGQLNGYWDATRGMTDADWALLQQDLLTAPFLNLKTKHLVFQMDADLVKKAEPKEMEGLMRIWDTICANEDRYMGVEDFEGRYNNIWNVFSGASSYMHASTYGTWYTESTIPTVMNYTNMRKVGSIWGPSHEIGHNHQGSINVCGTTESSNNLFSNINVFEQGIAASRRDGPSENFKQLAALTPWSKRDIWLTTSMFYQLYLYFHAMHHDDQFYPNLFRALRKNPIVKKSGWDNTTEFTYKENGQTKTGTGANITYGKFDYLRLAKTICDVAQADLSEFFESYGMFIPADKIFVGDYANYLVTTTQADIDAAKTEMQKYEKKLGNIIFIDDRVITHPVIVDGPFEAIASGNRIPMNDESKNQFLMENATSTYYGGDYMLYTLNAEKSTDDWYKLLSGNKVIQFQGTNYAGHKFYNANGNLIWATNAKTVSLPKCVTDLGIGNVTIMTANYDMTDTPCTDKNPADAINSIYREKKGNSDIYDLTGRRVAKPVKGLYIINGKKVIK